METPELSGAGAKQRSAENEPLEVQTAFIVVLTNEGQVAAIADLNAPVVPVRTPAGEEEMASLAGRWAEGIKLQLGSQMTAQMVVGMMQQLGQQMQQQQVTNKLVEGINQGRIPPPGR